MAYIVLVTKSQVSRKKFGTIVLMDLDIILTSPIRPSSLADAVVDRLREAMIRGHLLPGEKLSEVILSSKLGVSRSPIREALQRLELEGLVVSRPNRSTYVWDPTEEDLFEIYTIRRCVETLAGELIIEKFTAEDFQQLDLIMASELRAIHSGDLFTLIQEDKHFHEYVMLAANHRRLYETWKRIIAQWELLTFIRFRHDPAKILPSVIEDHKKMVHALREKDLAELDRVNREVNQRVLKEMLETNLFKKA